MDTFNEIGSAYIACRTTSDFKDRMTTYAQQRDLNISQVVRRGVKLLMENEKCSPAPSAWTL